MSHSTTLQWISAFRGRVTLVLKSLSESGSYLEDADFLAVMYIINKSSRCKPRLAHFSRLAHFDGYNVDEAGRKLTPHTG